MTVKDWVGGALVAAWFVVMIWCLHFLASGVLYGRP